LKKRNVHSRACSFDVVREMAPHSEAAVPYLLAALRNRSAALREAAASQLGSLASAHYQPEQDRLDWAPGPGAALADASLVVRTNAAIALKGLGERNQPITAVAADTRALVVDGLLRVIGEDEDDNTRHWAVNALAHWGDLPARAKGPLRKFMDR